MPTSPMASRSTTIEALLDQYSVFLLDMFGVLLNEAGPLPGAVDLLAFLQANRREYLIVSNGCRHLPDVYTQIYQRQGLSIPPERILSSSVMIREWVQARGLEGASAWVVGADSCKEVARQSGLVVVEPSTKGLQIIILADQSGIHTLADLEAVLTGICAAIDRDEVPYLLLPNPDMIYPVRAGVFGFTAGALAVVLEKALAVRYPGASWTFEGLGKPDPGIFLKAKALIPAATEAYLMLGDQLVTDIKGALNVGMDSALLITGVVDLKGAAYWPYQPTYILSTLERNK
jgi:HAD superfamily hydrolase (TIGR01459 family)